MKIKKNYLIVIFIVILSLTLVSCKNNEDGEIDAIAEENADGEVIHMDIKDNSVTEDLHEVVATANGRDVYLTEMAIGELEGYINSYKEGFEALFRYREFEGFSREELEDGIEHGFEILYKSHLEDAVKDYLCLEDMIEDGSINESETKDISPEEVRELTSEHMEDQYNKLEIQDKDLDEYIKKNQGDLIQYTISYLEFTNGENVDKINEAISQGKTLEEMKDFFTYGDDIELEFDGEDVLYRRLSKINYDSLYNRQIIKEKLDLITQLEEDEFIVGISEDLTKYRLLKLEDRKVDPGFIRDDLRELYKNELMIDKMDELWDKATIEILVSKQPLF